MNDATAERRQHELGYNERLFKGSGLRNFYHMARFKWVNAKLAQFVQGPLRIFELGCFDGRVLDQLPPERIEDYLGIDANWENGLDLARAKHGGRTNARFIEATDAGAMCGLADGAFNVAIALETVEHIPLHLLDAYLAEIARVTEGYVFVSVPVEMGPVFLAKYLAKAVRYGGTDDYTWREIANAARWNADGVRRDEHKGFDYRRLVKQLARHFEIVSVEGMPFAALPPSVSLTVGIVARSTASR